MGVLELAADCETPAEWLPDPLGDADLLLDWLDVGLVALGVLLRVADRDAPLIDPLVLEVPDAAGELTAVALALTEALPEIGDFVVVLVRVVAGVWLELLLCDGV